MTVPSQPRLMTTREAADRLGVHTKTVRRWVEAGHLRVAALTPGGQWRFNEADVDAVFTTLDHGEVS